jgi:hypothetical protein
MSVVIDRFDCHHLLELQIRIHLFNVWKLISQLHAETSWGY